MNDFETVIGLEVHLQLKTATKIFCGCANLFGQTPNSQTCPVCLGLPGTLPVLNRKVLLYALKVAMALNCQVNSFIKFDRKNYYYPDLPKGFQISQYDLPIAREGFVLVKGKEAVRKVGITRAHLEEDAGKLIHDPAANCSLVDYNRTGTPLIEIVSEPDMRGPQEAYDYLTALKLTLQYLDVSDCDMEKGSLRCDANVSIRPKGEIKFGTKVEIKNMNSFRAVKSALEFEESRQQKLLLAGNKIVQETQLWNEDKQATFSMRSKEEAHDYRYFPEPDLVPFVVDESFLKDVADTLPEAPLKKWERLVNDYGLSDYDAQIIISDKKLADFFEESSRLFIELPSTHQNSKSLPEDIDAREERFGVGKEKLNKETKKIANWIIGPLQQELNSRKVGVESVALKPKDFIILIGKVEDGTLNNLRGKEVLALMLDTNTGPEEIIAKKGLAQVSDTATLENIINDIIRENESTVTQIKQGKDSAIGFLVGQAMKKTQGKANPKLVGEMIKRRLLNV